MSVVWIKGGWVPVYGETCPRSSWSGHQPGCWQFGPRRLAGYAVVFLVASTGCTLGHGGVERLVVPEGLAGRIATSTLSRVGTFPRPAQGH
ncbi:MAG: hypothetical protein JO281_18125 [Pseudonocardiales bacterium]|nr:hypothetical protein [Pseudonocardiales bacterium]